MSDYCTYPLCKRVVSRNGFCFLHAVHFAGEKIKEKPKPIAKVSEKRKAINKDYKKIVKKALDEDPICKVQSPVCTKVAQGLHHKQKRSPTNLTKASNLIECCNACNLYIEENPVWAKDNGHTISRFKK
jgi:hypothetical protein